jgi:hypothetical protein
VLLEAEVMKNETLLRVILFLYVDVEIDDIDLFLLKEGGDDPTTNLFWGEFDIISPPCLRLALC